MISQNVESTNPFQETIIFWGLVFSLGALSLWTVLEGAAPAFLFLAILVFSFLATFLFPRAGMLSLIVCTIIFQRYFTQAPLIFNETLIKLYPLDAILGGALLFFIVALFIGRGRQSRWLTCDKWLVFFFGYVTLLLLAALFSGGLADGAIAFSTWKNYVFYGCFYFVTREIFSGENGRKVIGKTFFLAVGAALIFLAIGIVRGEGLWTEFTPLSTSGMRILDFPHALYFSIAFLALFFYSVSAPQIFGRYQKFLISVFPVLLLVGIIGSLMRHLWVGLFFGISVGFILLPSQFRGKFFRRAAVLLGIIMAMGLFGVALLTLAPQSDITHQAIDAVSTFAERVASLSNSSIDESVAWRWSVWQSAIASFSENPFFGTGLGQNVPVELGDYRTFELVRNIHNSWLALFVQTGLIGTAFFLVFLFSLAKRLYRKKINTPEAMGVRVVYGSLLVFYSIVFLFQPYLESNILATFFWMLLGLIAAFIQEQDLHS